MLEARDNWLVPAEFGKNTASFDSRPAEALLHSKYLSAKKIPGSFSSEYRHPAFHLQAS